jgi:hypothetical protein
MATGKTKKKATTKGKTKTKVTAMKQKTAA